MSMVHASRGVLKTRRCNAEIRVCSGRGNRAGSTTPGVVAWGIWWKIMIAFAMTLKLCCQSLPTITSASVILVVSPDKRSC